MTPETTVTIQAVVLILTACVGCFTFWNTRRKDIKEETKKEQNTYFLLSKDITKLGVKIDTFSGDLRELKNDVKEVNNQIKEINERAIRQDGKIDKQEERLNQLEKRVETLEKREERL